MQHTPPAGTTFRLQTDGWPQNAPHGPHPAWLKEPHVNRLLLSLSLAVLSLTFVPADVEAKRLGGGSTSGMKRQAPPPAQPATPAQQAAPKQAAPATPATPAAAPKRSWLGPIAGIAAGLGLAALMSHLGLGAEMANILTMVLLGVVAFIAVRFLMRRFARPGAQPQPGSRLQFAGAGAPAGAAGFGSANPGPRGLQPEPTRLDAPVAAPSGLPAGFDAAAFERIAKLIFIRMQAANDAGNLEDLRQFSTPEMFATFRLDLQDRKGAAQQTDVVQLDAQVIDAAQEDGQQIVSVRFHGLIREAPEAPAENFDEIWHLTKPLDGSREWAIAGIAQQA
jgi:predicted lipid-binding transport protein (Tim44 family)